MRRACAAVLAAAALGGCGAPPPDLFSVDRSGAGPGADVRMVVSDGGQVTCNGVEYPLDADRLLRARELARELAEQAELGIRLPPGDGTQLSYEVSLEPGSVAFSDTSPALPQSFLRVAAFTSDVAERVCGIEH